MKKVSSSPERHTFQKQSYIDKMKKADDRDKIDDLQAMIELYDQMKIDSDRKVQDPEWQKNNMEYDLRTTDWILEKVRTSESYAQNLYAAMCNNGFIKLDVIPILKQEEWSCSWRYAGGIVADMREQGDYIDWYCSGIRGDGEGENLYSIKYVREGCITDEIRNDLQRLGWAVAPDGDWENF